MTFLLSLGDNVKLLRIIKALNKYTPMDKLFINQLKVTTLIGVHAWEQLTPQNLLLDIAFEIDAKQVAQNDNFQEAIDYDQIIKHVLEFAEKNHFQLIETFVERLAQALLHHFPLPWIQLTLHKPGAVLQAKDVAITIERRRATATAPLA